MADLLDDKVVTTRKEHKCDFCHRIMPKGTKMRVAVVADDGTAFRFYQCLTCSRYYNEYWDGEDFYFNGAPIYSDDPEGWEEMRKKVEDGEQ